MNTSETTINRADIAICITKDSQTYADYPGLELEHFDKLFTLIENYLIQATPAQVVNYLLPDVVHDKRRRAIIKGIAKNLGVEIGGSK